MHPLLKTIAKEIVVQNNSGSGKITIGSSNFVEVRNDKEIGKLFFYLVRVITSCLGKGEAL